MPGTAGDCDADRFRVGLWDAALVEAAGYFFKLNTNLAAGVRALILIVAVRFAIKASCANCSGLASYIDQSARCTH